jgi:hypothetical protein
MFLFPDAKVGDSCMLRKDKSFSFFSQFLHKGVERIQRVVVRFAAVRYLNDFIVFNHLQACGYQLWPG